ncbi:MAG: hypothetical protein NC343_04195 [Muribaculum sp.]|nr:hypothetical protein [Muribaculaceae bacterium]MCM1080931.1 hypothetical protein [Muribaculum sp.]
MDFTFAHKSRLTAMKIKKPKGPKNQEITRFDKESINRNLVHSNVNHSAIEAQPFLGDEIEKLKSFNEGRDAYAYGCYTNRF